MKKQKQYIKSPRPQQHNDKVLSVEEGIIHPVKKRSELYIQSVLIFLLGFGLYANTLFFDYTLDDRLMIFENKFTTAGIKSLGKILTKDAFVGYFGEEKNLLTGGRYRPLTHVMFAIEWELFKNNPFEGHLINIILYGLLGVLLLRLLFRILPENKGDIWYLSLPFYITALFIAHPIHTEVVANIKGRDEIVTMLTLLGCIHVVLNYVDKRSYLNLFLIFPMFFLALLAKENALTFVAVIPLVIWFFRYEHKKSILPVMGLIVLALGVYFALRFRFDLMKFDNKETELLNNPYIGAAVSDKFATIFYTMGKYIQLLIFPHPLTHDYYPKQIPIIGWGDPRAFLSLLLYIGIGIVGIWGLIKRNIWGFAIALYLATFSISSNLFFNIGAFMNERFMFIPSLGFSIVVGVLVLEVWRKRFISVEKFRSVSKWFLIVVLSLYSLKTVTRNMVWKDDFTLFTSDVKISTNSAKVNVSAGGMLVERAQKENNPMLKRQMLEQAKIYLAQGTTLHKHYVAGWVLYGNAFLYSEQYKEAILCYENSLNIAPQYNDALINLLYAAQKTYQKQMYDVSILAYRKLIKVQPDKLAHRVDLASVMDDIGQVDSALMMLNQVLEKDPKNSAAYNRIGQIYGKKKGDIVNSIAFLNKAITFDARNASAWENLGVAYGIQGKFQQSIHALEKAAELNPKNFQTYENMSVSYKSIGNMAKSEEYHQKAVKVKSENEKKE